MPIIRNKSKQYLFKNKVNIRRKSRKEKIRESFFMILSALFLLLMIYLIPKKMELFSSFKKNFLYIFNNIWEILLYSFEILIVLLICLTLIFSIFLIIGSLNRIIRLILTKSGKIRIR